MANEIFMKRVSGYVKARDAETPLLLLDVPGAVIEARYGYAKFIGPTVDFHIHIDKGITSAIRHLGVLGATDILDGRQDLNDQLAGAGAPRWLDATESLRLYAWLSALVRPPAPLGPRQRLSPLAV